MKNIINYGYKEAQLQPETTQKVGAKTPQKIKSFAKPEAIKLLSTGMTQKDIAIKLCVTEKTIGNWAKESKEAQKITAETLKNLKLRLLEMTKDKAPIVDIKNLISSIKQLENK